MIEKKDINQLATGKFFASLRFNLLEIIKMGKNTIRIKCLGWYSANKILKSDIIKSSGYKPFIPFHFSTTVGIARGVPIEWTIEKVKANSVCGSRILNMERMNFWDAKNGISKTSECIKI